MSKNEDKPSLFDMYSDLLNQETMFSQRASTKFNPNDEDSETFVTLDELNKEQNTDDGLHPVKGPVEIEEELHFKRFTKPRKHKYTDQEMEEIRKSCIRTIVHDFSQNDIYHMSDEERAKNDSLNELRMKLNGLKTMYRRIDQYIYAMRVVVQAWEILAKDNYIHTEDEFFKMVSEGKIYSTSIPLPKMQHMDKYNMDLIIRYISNPELDPTDLMPASDSKYDPWYNQFESDETEEEEMERLLSPEEVQYILDYADDPLKIKVHDIKRKYIKGYDNRSRFGSSKKKKFKKKEKYMVDNLHSLLNKIQSNPNNRDGLSGNRSYLITSSMFEPQKKPKNPLDEIKFTGSWTSDEDLFVYDLVMEEERLKMHPSGDPYMTYGDKELQEFFSTMEANGMSTLELRRKMNMSESQLQQREMEKKKKDNKKTEAQILQRIIKLNQSEKFKKLVDKAEKQINESYKD